LEENSIPESALSLPNHRELRFPREVSHECFAVSGKWWDPIRRVQENRTNFFVPFTSGDAFR